MSTGRPMSAARSTAAAVLLPVLLWGAAMLFLGGAIGKWNDDYFFLGQFDRDTGEVHRWTLTRPLHFWRPLYRVVATPLNTLLFEHDRINHIITASVHGAVCLALFGLLRRLGAGRVGAALAAMIFMVHPAHFEGALWNTVMFTPLATGVMLAAISLAWRWHRREGPRGWWIPGAIGVMVFAGAGMNEQPAAMAGALPALALLSGRGRLSRRGVWAPPSKWWPTAAACAGIGVYLAGQAMMTRFLPRAVGAEEIPRRIALLAGDVWRGLTLHRFGGGALRQGWREIAASPATAALWGAALAGALVAWALWARRVANEDKGAERDAEGLPPWRLALLGAAIFTVVWLPIARVDYDTSPRLFYAPNVGLAMMLAAVLTGMDRAGAGWRAARQAVAACLLAAAILFAVMMIGVQSAYRARFLADEAQGAELRRLVPDPGERAVFVPVHIEDRPVRAGRGGRAFEGHFLSPWRSPWAAGWYVQRLYGRGDIFACLGAWPEEAEIRPNLNDGRGGAREFTFTRTFAQPHPRTERLRESLIRWNQAVLFAVNERGRVVVVTRVRIERPDGSVAEFEPRRTTGAAAEDPRARRVLVLRQREDGTWAQGLEREGSAVERGTSPER